MLKMSHPKSTIATAVSMGVLGLVLNSPALAQTTTTNATGATTVSASNSGSGAISADGTTTINAATVSGSGTAASGTTAPVDTRNSVSGDAAGSSTTTTNASGTTKVGAVNSGAGNVNASGSTTVNATTVSGSGTAASGTTGSTAGSTQSPTSTAAPATTNTSSPTGSQTASGTTAPIATSSSTSNANATAVNENNFYITGATVSNTPPASETTSGGYTINGNNNIIGNNNNTITGNNNNAISATNNSNSLNGSTTTASAGSAGTSTSALSGSGTNSLQQGLRNGTAVTLTGAGETATFTPPTGHMGKGEADRAVTLANRSLASAGISDPTPTQLQAALVGGTVTNAQGQSTTMEGVLQQRNQGMGWGNIAKANGVHPSQSEQGAINSQRGGNIASNSHRNDRSNLSLSRNSGRNQIARNNPASGVSGMNGASNHSDRSANRSQPAQAGNRGGANNVVASIPGRGNDHSRNALSAPGPAGTKSVASSPAKISSGSTADSQAAGKAKTRKNGPASTSGPDRGASTLKASIGGDMSAAGGGRGHGSGGIKAGK